MPFHSNFEPINPIPNWVDISEFPVFIDAAGFRLKCTLKDCGDTTHPQIPTSDYCVLSIIYKDGTETPFPFVQSFSFVLFKLE